MVRRRVAEGEGVSGRAYKMGMGMRENGSGVVGRCCQWPTKGRRGLSGFRGGKWVPQRVLDLERSPKKKARARRTVVPRAMPAADLIGQTCMPPNPIKRGIIRS